MVGGVHTQMHHSTQQTVFLKVFIFLLQCLNHFHFYGEIDNGAGNWGGLACTGTDVVQSIQQWGI
jgi:hypothetical protein